MTTNEQKVMRYSGGTLEYKDAERKNTVKIQLIRFQKRREIVSRMMMEKICVIHSAYILRMCVVLNVGVIG